MPPLRRAFYVPFILFFLKCCESKKRYIKIERYDYINNDTISDDALRKEILSISYLKNEK
jgi:hypothetical protein